ncbi:MAG: heat-inducible transcriptional repressor HrcA [Proteobacteria bacterium]|nr:heat-inducible transcriptional repressor HrcA [Pseudomonadota bacterium]
MLKDLNARTIEVFRHLVDAYCASGEPVGSRLLSQRLEARLSPATIRSIMANLEDLGLLFSPHTSAGRLPTEKGLRLFVDGLLQVGELSLEERAQLELQRHEPMVARLLEEATQVLSGLTGCVGLVVSPKEEAPLKHVEFVRISQTQALVVLVFSSGNVENRVLNLPAGLPASCLTEASNYLNTRFGGLSLREAKRMIFEETQHKKDQLDTLSQGLIEAGLGQWSGPADHETFIFRGQANLLGTIQHMEDLERMRLLFEELESRKTLMKLLDASLEAEGVQIYMGADSALFQQAGCALVAAPYGNRDARIVGAIGVIGPRHLNYARIVPIVDYTAKMMTRLMETL